MGSSKAERQTPVPPLHSTKTTYLDHNVVVDIMNERSNEALAAVKRAELTFVLSPAHWIEAARSSSFEQACRTAKTMDDLQAHWLRERRELQRREVRAWTCGKSADLDIIQPICRTVSELASDYSGVTGAIAIVTSEMMVRHMQKDGSFLKIIGGAYKGNAEGFERNVDHVRDGRLTPETEQRIWNSWVESVAQEIDLGHLTERLVNADRFHFPSILTEYEIAKENWARGVNNPEMKLNPSRLSDCFHVIAALPYVDCIVSRDNGFRGLVTTVRSRLPFRTARPVESLEQLLDEFGKP